MKDLLSDAVAKKLNATLEAVGGVRALYGDPVTFNGEEIIPVARVSITLGADAEGSGGGDSGASARLNSMAKGGGGGKAKASTRVDIEPVGFLRAGADGPVFVPLD